MSPDDDDPPEAEDGPRDADEDEASPDDEQDAPEDRDDDAGARAPREELRAKDLMNRTREELEEELDPATMSELASWFLRPSMAEARERAVPEDVQRGPEQAQLDAFERLAMQLGGLDEVDLGARERALAAIEPRMIDLFDRHERAADRAFPPRIEPRQVIDETLLPARVRALVVAEGEELPPLGQARLLEPSPDIADLLNQDNAPQAVLRDLNRPVQEFERRLERIFAPPSEEEDLTFAIRDALRWRPEKVPPKEPLPDSRLEWQPLLQGSWTDLVAAAKVIREAELKEADEQLQRDAEAGILWKF